MANANLSKARVRRYLFPLLVTCATRFLACFSWSSTRFLRWSGGGCGVRSSKKDTALSSVTALSYPSSYEAAQITVLEGLEAVRQRPGMYVGSTGADGLHQLMWEVVDNSVDEHLAGFASLIEVYIHKDGRTVTVSDNGRGIPVDIHPSTGKSALETCLTVLHAGGKFNSHNSQNNSYRVSGGLHGVGISVVNALSSHVRVEVARNEFIYSMEFSKGKPTTALQRDECVCNDDNDTTISEDRKKRWTKTSGTRVTFLPDDIIFKTWQWDHNRLLARLEEITFLNPDLTIIFADERQQSLSKASESEKSHIKTLHHAGGLVEYMQILCQGKEPLMPEQVSSSMAKKKTKTQKKTTKNSDQSISMIAQGPLAGLLDEKGTVFCKGVTTSSGEQITLSVALRWSADQYTESILSFVNNIRTKDGGTHVEGLKSCITRTINTLTKKSGSNSASDDGGSSIPGEYIREGLTAILSVQVPDPEFEGQTKTRLGNPHVRHAVEAIVSKELCKVFDWQPELLHSIINKATMAQKAAQAAKAARDVVRRKTLLTSAVLPGKLSDCASRDPTISEIFIVEGDSAAGSAKQGRDRRTQAILPLRGKILNIERASADKIYQNNELQGLISALGLGVKGSNFEKKSLRYHRIIIMTDADVDGAHIRVLLLTFFYRYQRELVENGHVFIAQPPLYKLSMSGGGKKKVQERYAYNDMEKEKVLQEWRGGDTISTEDPPTESFEGEDLLQPSDAAASRSSQGKISIQRFKGLGEMMPEQLWKTTMDPSRRKLLQVTVQDCSLADQMLNVLMGDAVGPRKDYISEHAEYVKITDIDL